MRKKIIIGNWKMHKSFSEVKDFIKNFNMAYTPQKDQIIGFAVPNIYIDYLVNNTTDLVVAAEDCSIFNTAGAYTSAVSADMIASVGATYTLVGHSERRNIFGDTDEKINQKIKNALSSGLKVIMCVGEPLEVFKTNSTCQFINNQLVQGLQGISASDLENIVIAYEPIWAIGTGETATPQIAQSVIAFIRNTIEELYNTEVASQLLIQYGGSANVDNAAMLIREKDIDGLLIGGASLDPHKFLKIIEKIEGK